MLDGTDGNEADVIRWNEDVPDDTYPCNDPTCPLCHPTNGPNVIGVAFILAIVMAVGLGLIAWGCG